jgi:sodium/hydrogen exchanger 8
MQPRLAALLFCAFLLASTYAEHGTEHASGNKTAHSSGSVACHKAGHSGPEKKADMAMLLHVFLLLLVFVLGFVLSSLQFKYLGEAGVGLLVGAAAGAILLVTHGVDVFEESVKFNEHIFFLVLLPPIIFEAGYNMKRRYFFRNFGAICMYAFAGTFISTFVVGILVFLVGQAGLAVKFTFLESLVFGCLISATDPVTVLAVFSKLNANKDLFSFVFGESVLNDAVAIVLYVTLGAFRTEEFTAGACLLAVLQFIEIFFVSFVIGAGSAMLLAYWCKKNPVGHDEDLEHAQMAAVTITPYIAYLLAESLSQSGIVTILFCGIGMAVFVRPNITSHTRDFTTKLAKALAHIFETYVFVYLGLSLFTINQVWDTAVMSIYASVICMLARACNIYPCSYILNKGGANIDSKKQFTMWFAGLRGAIAFVLALKSKEDFKDGNGDTILTTTILIIFFTVFVMGGYIWPLLERFELRDPPDPKPNNPYHNAIDVLQRVNLVKDMSNMDPDDKENLDQQVDEAIEALRSHASDLEVDMETLEMIKTGQTSRDERDEMLIRHRELCHDFDDEDDSTWLGELAVCLRPFCNSVVLRVKRTLTTQPDANHDDVEIPMQEVRHTRVRADTLEAEEDGEAK